MAAKRIAPGLFEVSLGMVNVFLLETDGGLALIDAGYPNMADTVLAAVRQIGKQPADIQHIIITHAHPDHFGSLAALQRATGATTYVHTTDAAIVRTGRGVRPIKPSPGLMSNILFRLFIRPMDALEGARVDHELHDGDVLPIAGGLHVVHTPGHCAGHVALLWPQERVLVVGDACANIPRLGLSIAYEDVELGKRSLAKLAKLDFDTACFGHGKALRGNANLRFRKRWL